MDLGGIFVILVVQTRVFGGLVAKQLQPQNFQKIRAGWLFFELELRQLEWLEL